ncbi:MAG: glycosyltransferase WbuB, partial [Chthoniobacterales bacterium]
MKTFVFVNRVYPPVRGATGELLKELAEALVGPDTRVVVVTSEGAEAGGRREQKQNTVNGVEVIRVGG